MPRIHIQLVYAHPEFGEALGTVYDAAKQPVANINGSTSTRASAMSAQCDRLDLAPGLYHYRAGFAHKGSYTFRAFDEQGKAVAPPQPWDTHDNPLGPWPYAFEVV